MVFLKFCIVFISGCWFEEVTCNHAHPDHLIALKQWHINLLPVKWQRYRSKCFHDVILLVTFIVFSNIHLAIWKIYYNCCDFNLWGSGGKWIYLCLTPTINNIDSLFLLSCWTEMKLSLFTCFLSQTNRKATGNWSVNGSNVSKFIQVD